MPGSNKIWLSYPQGYNPSHLGDQVEKLPDSGGRDGLYGFGYVFSHIIHGLITNLLSSWGFSKIKLSCL
jgi:hypothetical protein